eukprot:CAMPEP_0197850936 /NCGR_PEP_ID=MMETSP1438-20131217/16822_1 /TAXON_ID=1461541 /ORGANISM="Pterosperma sp., Strain CCMP1384" /LENGTH=913 /DNA_ID=CAMNT_0043464361 /DNA_START=162 /DNA_END=2903 /DNA_ORIENTATION=-
MSSSSSQRYDKLKEAPPPGAPGATEEIELNIDHSLLNTGEDGLDSNEWRRRLSEFGRNELEEKTKSKWTILLGHFTGPMPCMIWTAIFIEALIQDWPNFWVLLVLQVVNGLVGFHEDSKAGDAVAALKASLKPEAQVKRDGKWTKTSAAELVPGDRVALNAGANVPADCKVCEGLPIDIDQAALTGESLPVTFYPGDIAKMGSTVVRGEIDAIVASTGSNTFFGKTAAMIQSVDEIPHFQVILLSVTKFLLAVSMVLVGICLVFLLSNGEGFLAALAFCVVLLVASIPIAMQVVCTTTMALGSRKLAEQKAIVARLSSIEQLASMNMLCSDKTGTLTLNKMVLQEVFSYVNGVSSNDILVLAALAAKWKEPAKDALDTLVLNAIDLEPLDAYEQLDYIPFDPSKKRTESTLLDPQKKKFSVMKGAPNIVLGFCSNKSEIEESFEAQVDNFANRGIRCLAVARKYDGADGHTMMGLLTFLDPPRPDTKETIERAKDRGVGVKMITGDHSAIAKETCRTLGLGDNICLPSNLPDYDIKQELPLTLGDEYGEQCENCDGFAQVYPEHKFIIVEALRQRGWACGMTGDGVNDAPALKKADVGIAVQGATDAARAAADLILTAPGLSVIIDAITISRSIFQRMKNYVIYRVACTIQLLSFFFIAVIFLHPRRYFKPLGSDYDPPPYFNLPVVALVVITILNDGTIISIAYDHVIPSSRPERWNLPVVFSVACWLGLVAVASSMLLLHWGLEAQDPDGFFRNVMGLEDISYEEVMTMLYLKISLSDFFTVFAARTQGHFWERKPGQLLFIAAVFATMSSTALSMHWPFGKMASLNSYLAILTWMYCIIWFLIQDYLKVVLYKALYHHDVDGIRTEAEACEKLASENSLPNRVARLEVSMEEMKRLLATTPEALAAAASK